METLFIKSIREKYRFSTKKGQLSTEDLWDLSLEALDEIAISIHDGLEKVGKRSFVRQKTKQTDELQTKFDVVKYVIETKIAEANAKRELTKKKGQLDFLKKLKEKKEIEKLEGMSSEELDRQIKELEELV